MIDPKYDVLFTKDATVWFGCPPQKDGFLVAIRSFGIRYPYPDALSDVDHREFEALVGKLKRGHESFKYRMNEACTIGSWKYDGVLYIDVCNWYKHMGDAIAFAIQEKQLAIWDITSNNSIFAKYYAGSTFAQ